MVRTPEEWIEFYCKETNDVFNVPKGYRIVAHPTRGLCVYSLQDNFVSVYEACGDCLYWKDFIETVFIYSGAANTFGTICTKNIKAYIRLLGYEFVDGDIEGRFLARDKNMGHAVLCTARGENKNGEKEYIVTAHYNVKCPSSLNEFLEREDAFNVETE